MAIYKKLRNDTMNDTQASFACQYRLDLSEAKAGFRLATRSRQKMPYFLTPLIGVALIIFGWFWQENAVGKYYMALGGLFLAFQIIMQGLVMPWLFRRQYQKYQYQQLEYQLELYQDQVKLRAGSQKRTFAYSEVEKFLIGRKIYVLELADKSMLMVSKQAVHATGQQALFEQAFQNRR